MPRSRARTPAKRGPFSRFHYGVRRARDASRGSAFAETPAGGMQLSRPSKETPRGDTPGGRFAQCTGPGAALLSTRRHLEVCEILPGTRQTPFAEHRTGTRKIPVRDARDTQHKTAVGPFETLTIGAITKTLFCSLFTLIKF